jgi:hypothetical protein
MLPNLSARGFGDAVTEGPVVPSFMPGLLTGEPAALPTFKRGLV